MATLRDFKLEYAPCKCPSHVQSDKALEVTNAAEHFVVAKIAALRFRQLVVEGKSPRVHHDGTHVSAVILNGERFEEG